MTDHGRAHRQQRRDQLRSIVTGFTIGAVLLVAAASLVPRLLL